MGMEKMVRQVEFKADKAVCRYTLKLTQCILCHLALGQRGWETEREKYSWLDEHQGEMEQELETGEAGHRLHTPWKHFLSTNYEGLMQFCGF